MSLRAQVQALLDAAHADGIAPGLSCAVHSARADFTVHAGRMTYAPETTEITDAAVWDLASLTKVIATFHCLEQLAEEGRIDAATRLGDILPEVADTDKAALRLTDLMAHRAGFNGAIDYFNTCHTSAQLRQAVRCTPLVHTPGGTRIYDDASYMLLGWGIEALCGAPLDVVIQRRICAPQGMTHTRYTPSPDRRAACVPTGYVPALGLPLQGIVHDDNARVLGGVAGHAGLFGTVADLLRFGLHYIAWRRLPRAFDLTAYAYRDATGTYTLGWDIGHPRTMPAHVGVDWLAHTGFTGTMLALCPRRETVVALCTNRVHPTGGSSDGINALRRAVLDCVIAAG